MHTNICSWNLYGRLSRDLVVDSCDISKHSIEYASPLFEYLFDDSDINTLPYDLDELIVAQKHHLGVYAAADTGKVSSTKSLFGIEFTYVVAMNILSEDFFIAYACWQSENSNLSTD